MSRRPHRLLPAALPMRVPLATLLVAWLLALIAPALHVHVGHDDADELHAADSHAAADCHAPQPVLPAHATFATSCQNGGDCDVPGHHHHSHDARLHDAAGCQSCASLFERRVEAPVPYAIAPLRVERLARAEVRQSPPAQRAVFSQARGPPVAVASPRRCALLVA